MKRIAWGIGTALVMAGAFLLVRSLNMESRQLENIPPLEAVPLPNAVTHLSAAIRVPTISHADSLPVDSSAFDAFGAFLESSYPRIHRQLDLRRFNRYSRLYHWPGKDSRGPAMILAAHLDVVPVPDTEREDWRNPPFSGAVVNDTLWGRGAIDDKFALIAIMEAVEHLLAEGFQPERDIWLALGHDEEIGGHRGAQEMARWLKEQNVQARLVLDEGYAVLRNLVPGIQKDVAVIGTAEKGYATVRLSVHLPGGHSSMPEKNTAIDVLAAALQRLKAHPFPARFVEPVQAFLDYIGPEMPFPQKLFFANAALFEPLLLNIYSARASGNAMVRTTTAPTLFHAGVKDNIIPARAGAVVNFRLLPGETSASVLAHVREVVDDPRVRIRMKEFFAASPVSPVDNEAFRHLQRTIQAVYPGVLVTPNLVVGGTDGRYYYAVSEAVYRFVPFHITPQTIKIFHGVNERIPVEDIQRGVLFYKTLIKSE